MMNKVKIFFVLSLMTTGFLLVSGNFVTVSGQIKDPFYKKPVAKPAPPKPVNPTGSNTSSPNKDAVKPIVVKPTPPPIMAVAAPPIEQRIAYYKAKRDEAIQLGLPLPKVTSVLTLEEMAISGISKTSRGFAAMIEAKPIKLSYTVFPGEKFFDCQLVAIEENKLVFRKITKMSNNQFISSIQEKSLREYNVMEDIQGTSPTGDPKVSGKTESAINTTPAGNNAPQTNSQNVISPLDEMLTQPKSNGIESEKAKAKNKPATKSKPPTKKAKAIVKPAAKTPVKVAKVEKE